MPRRKELVGSILYILLLVSAHGQSPGPWRDPSPHSTQFVTVDHNLRLEVLDWGGSGRPIVLLAGAGNTAHVFDDFAPKLTADYHVYGITRRGFGASSFSGWNYDADRLGNDVLAVLDALNLNRPVLVGHSLAGEELSSIAKWHPERVAALIYLDAAYTYAFDNGASPTEEELEEVQLKRPQPPPPSGADLASFAALQQWYERVLGLRFPEAELRQLWSSTSDGWVGPLHVYSNWPMIRMGMNRYADIPVPALVIFALPHGLGPWVDGSTDPAVRKAAQAFSAADYALTERQIMAVDNGVYSARVVRMKQASHFVFLSNEAVTLREMRAFLRRRY